MRRWAGAAVVGLVGLVALGFVVSYLGRLRRAASDLGCANNLREIGLFAAHHADTKAAKTGRFATEIPAGTIPLAGYRPDERLSWFPALLTGFDQKRQDTQPLLSGLQRLQPFAHEANQAVARTPLRVALCPGNPPPTLPLAPAPTCYVGVSGLGTDPEPPPPRAGCFHPDRPTSFEAITDGLSQSLLLGERSVDLRPWLRGGPATVRGLDDRPDAPPLFGGQFGGNHAGGANWGFADGGVRFFTGRTDPRVLFALATIAGGERDPLPGE